MSMEPIQQPNYYYQYSSQPPWWDGVVTEARLVAAALILDLMISGLLIATGLAGASALGPTWLRLTTGGVLIALVVLNLVSFALVIWHPPPPPPPRRRAARTILMLVVATAGIILGYTLLYWNVLGVVGLPAFYAAVGTLTAVHPPSVTTTTGNLLLVSQELVDLVFLSGVVAVALGRAFNR